MGGDIIAITFLCYQINEPELFFFSNFAFCLKKMLKQ